MAGMNEPTIVLAWPAEAACGCLTILNHLESDADPSVGDRYDCDTHGLTTIVELRRPHEIVLGDGD